MNKKKEHICARVCLVSLRAFYFISFLSGVGIVAWYIFPKNAVVQWYVEYAFFYHAMIALIILYNGLMFSYILSGNFLESFLYPDFVLIAKGYYWPRTLYKVENEKDIENLLNTHYPPYKKMSNEEKEKVRIAAKGTIDARKKRRSIEKKGKHEE